MARLPTRQDLGPLPALPPNRGAAIARIRQRAPDTSAEFRGVQDLARGVTAIGIAAETIADHEQKKQKFDTEMRFQEFKWGQEQALEERLRTAQPGEVDGMTDRWQEDFQKGHASEFFKTVPEELKANYERKLFGVERDLYGSAKQFEQQEMKRVSVNRLDDAKNNIYSSKARMAPTDELDSITSEYDSLVDANPNLTPIERDELKRKAKRDIAKTHLNNMTPAEIEKTFTNSKASVVDRIIGVESGGKADAKNPNSTATGAGQFIESTWLDIVKRNRPDIARGRSDAELLELRKDPRLSREMVGVLMNENRQALEGAGVPTDSGSLYLAHFLGAGGAINVLRADPDTPVSNILSPKVINANRSVLAGKSVGEVMQWAEKKMGGSVPEAFTYLTDDDRQKALDGIKDFLKNKARAQQLFSGQDVADPDNKDDRKAVDFVVERSGLNEQVQGMDPASVPALTTVVQTTGIVPESTATTMRSMAVNGSPQEREFALQTAANLLRQKPGALDHKGMKDLKDDARAFSSFVEAGGLEPQEALKRVDETKTEEYRNRKAALKTEADAAAKLLKPEQITDAFDTVFGSEPALGATKIRGQIMFDAFKENFKHHFYGKAAGDAEVAKNMALKDVRDSYDVSEVTGTKKLMKHPPEKYYPAVDGSHEYFTKQLQADVTAKVGKDVPQDSIFIEAVPQTDADIRAGKLPRYGVSWLNEKGEMDTAPNMVWKPDFAAAKKRSTERNRRRFNDLREETKGIQLMNLMGGELFLPEAEGAPAELIQQKQDNRQMSLLDAIETGGLA